MTSLKRILILPACFAVILAGVSGCNSKKTTPSVPSQSTSATGPVELNVDIAKGKSVGGLHEFKVKSGAQVTLTVSSTDTTSEIHLHGYNIMAELSPNHPAVLHFIASITGVFEVELEETSVKIIDLTVS